MKCPICKEPTSEDYRYCLQCGADLGEVTVVSHPPLTPTPQRRPIAVPFESTIEEFPQHNGLPYFWIVIGLLIGGFLVGGLVVAYLYASSGPERDLSNQPALSSPNTSRPLPSREDIQTKVKPTAEATEPPGPSPITTPLSRSSAQTLVSEEFNGQQLMRIQIPQGERSVVIHGPTQRGIDSYIFKARAGQTMSVRLDDVSQTSASVFFSVTEALNHKALTPMGDMRGTWVGAVPYSGDFIITVCCSPAIYKLELSLAR